MRSAARILWRTAAEGVLALYACALCGLLLERSGWAFALADATLGLFVVGGALRTKAAKGTLRLAGQCPRVDALGLPVPTSEPGWRAVRAAEDVLDALSREARGYRDFLPEAHRDVRTALSRALRAHAGREEVEAVIRKLEEISCSLRTARIPSSERSAGQALDGLALRAGALAEAVSELAPLAKVLTLTRGDRP